MKPLIEHLIRTNGTEALKMSLANCHVKGMYSIVFQKSPMIRLYYADRNHELWMNHPSRFYGQKDISLSIHPHHCDLTLVGVLGKFINITFEVTNGELSLNKFIYKPSVGTSESKPTIIPDGVESLTLKSHYPYSTGESVFLPASILHTIYVPHNQQAAWLVLEGAEDHNYENVMYSNHSEIEMGEDDGYYQPVEMYQIHSILQDCFSIGLGDFNDALNYYKRKNNVPF